MKYSIDFTNKFKKSLKKSVKRGLDPELTFLDTGTHSDFILNVNNVN